MTASFRIIESCLIAGAHALFDACNRSAEYRGGCNGPAPVNDRVFLASIGFAAVHVRGNVVVVGSREAVDVLTPEDFTPEHDSARGEVLAEFTNMLVGRLKQRLRRHNLKLMAGTPTCALARGAEIQGPSSGYHTWHAFALMRSTVYVRLEATFTDGFALGPENTTNRAELESGIVLF